MRLRPRSQRCSTWLAVLAMLWMALAPLASQALGPRQSEAWIEICGANGAKWIKADAGSPAQPQPGAHPLDHCPYCSVHASALGMPPAPLMLLPAALRYEVPQAFLAAPRTLHAWRTAQARAPPLQA